jgi:hypothetical protein
VLSVTSDEHLVSEPLLKVQWRHHQFDLWELVAMGTMMKLANHNDGLHFAGNYIFGMGHN